MLRDVSIVICSSFLAIMVAALLAFPAPALSGPNSTAMSKSAESSSLVITVAKYKKKRLRRSTRRSGSGNFAATGGGQFLIPKGGCCSKVLNHCATICNRSGGCTGNGDCSTNPD